MLRDGHPSLSRVIRSLQARYKGPGGAVAVIRDGQVIVRHAWGYANVTRRVAMTTQTVMPICSITKQFTCAVLLRSLGDPSQLDPDLSAYLPLLQGARPAVVDVFNNQSGLRDYPALTILCGADPE